MAAPSPEDALQSVMDIADILSGFLGGFEVSSVVSKPPSSAPPKPKSKKPPPLALPRTRTIHFPENKAKMSLAIIEHLRSVYMAKIKQLRRIAQEEYARLCRSIPGGDFDKIGNLLRTSYRASEDQFGQQAIEACLDAHDLAVNPPTNPDVPQVKRPFNRTMVAIFEYIFDQPSGNYINAIDKQRLADLAGMTERQITVWFQNRRARTKQKIIAGKTPEPMTLEKALVKLHADCEKAKAEKINSTGFKEITFKRTEKVLVDEDEDSDDDDDAISPRDQYEDDIKLLYATGILPNLDVINPSPGSFPRRFRMPTYPEPRFDAPVWPRASRQLPSKPLVLVTKQEVRSLAKMFDDVVELEKTITVVTRRTVTFPLPLPPTIQEAVTRRDARKIRNSKPDLVTPEPDPIDDEDTSTIQPIPSIIQEFLKSIPKKNQVQINGSQDIANQGAPQLNNQMTAVNVVRQPYVAPPLPPTMTALTMQLSRTDLSGEAKSNNSSASGSSSGSIDLTPVVIPSLASFLGRSEDPQEPVEVFMADDLVTTRVNPTDYPPVINIEDCIPLAGVLTDSESMIEALKMTLKELKWKGPLPANIDEPFVFNYVPSMAPDPPEHCLASIEHIFKGREDEIMPPADAATMDLGGRVLFDLNAIPMPPPLPTPTDAHFLGLSFGQEYIPTESVGNSDVPIADQIYDAGDMSLPFVLADSVLESFSIPATWEPSASSNLDDWVDDSQPSAPGYLTPEFLTNVDTSAGPTFDQGLDPQGSALPFALINQDPVFDPSFLVMDTMSDTEHETFQAETNLFYDQQFPDSYTFVPPPSQVQLPVGPYTPVAVESPVEPPTPAPVEFPLVSFYPSYLPQVPLLTKEIVRAATFMHDWLDKAVGIKLKAPSFIDPEAMLQYLA